MSNFADADTLALITRLEQQLVAKNAVIEQVRNQMFLYNLFSCEGSDSYDPECASQCLDKVREIVG